LSTETTNPLEEVAGQIAKLQAENERLRAEQGSRWQLEQKCRDLTGELSKLQRTADKLLSDNAELARHLRYWKQAVRYEQALKKKDRRQVRHLPVFNGVKRSDRELFNKLAQRCGDKTASGRKTPERVFLRNWRKENRRRSGLNGGFGALELILSENSNEHAAGITQRDATVAASVVQWLGTNCGQAFIYECEQEIKRSRG
jgi:sugar phosphate isomerase/epimerase